MSEQPPVSQPYLESNENQPVTKEQVINAYAKLTNGKEDGPAKELLTTWSAQRMAEIRSIPDHQKQNYETISFTLEELELYSDLGFDELALEGIEEFNGVLDMADLANEDGLYNQALGLADKIRAKMESHEELLVSNDIMPSDVKMTQEKLYEQQAETDASLARDLSAEILAMLKNKS